MFLKKVILSVQSIGGDEDPIEAKKAIVFLSTLLQLFSICRIANCGSYVEPQNIKVTSIGAMIRVKASCNNNHDTEWESSPCVGTGTKRIPVINVLIASFCLLTGLHIKQVANVACCMFYASLLYVHLNHCTNLQMCPEIFSSTTIK